MSFKKYIQPHNPYLNQDENMSITPESSLLPSLLQEAATVQIPITMGVVAGS